MPSAYTLLAAFAFTAALFTTHLMERAYDTDRWNLVAIEVVITAWLIARGIQYAKKG